MDSSVKVPVAGRIVNDSFERAAGGGYVANPLSVNGWNEPGVLLADMAEQAVPLQVSSQQLYDTIIFSATVSRPASNIRLCVLVSFCNSAGSGGKSCGIMSHGVARPLGFNNVINPWPAIGYSYYSEMWITKSTGVAKLYQNGVLVSEEQSPVPIAVNPGTNDYFKVTYDTSGATGAAHVVDQKIWGADLL